MKRQPVKLLYPRNQAFIDGKTKQPANAKEIIYNIKQIEMSFMTPTFVYLFAVIGAFSFLACIAIAIQIIISLGDPDAMYYLNPMNPGVRIRHNWLIGGIVAVFFSGVLGIGNIRWAFHAYPYLKYPSMGERHYRLLVDNGTTIIGIVKEVSPLSDEKFMQVEYTIKKGREFGKWDTVSPVARGLSAGDRVYVYKQGDHVALL